LERKDLTSTDELSGKWKDYLDVAVEKELETRVDAGEISREQADAIKRDVIEEATVGQSIAIMRQIETNVVAELDKSLEAGDLSQEDYDKTKYGVMADIAKEYNVSGVAILIEAIKNAELFCEAQVKAGKITKEQADQMKYDIVEEVAEEEMTRIINASISRTKNMFVKYASAVRKLKVDFKMGKLLDKYAGKVDLLEKLNLEAMDNSDSGEIVEEDKGEGEVK
jgi:polyhydroxyalkanoate synthesis regulator phasin